MSAKRLDVGRRCSGRARSGKLSLVMYYKCMSHTAFNLDGAVLAVQGVIVEVHHAGERRGEPHPVRNAAVSAEPHQLVSLRHIVQETIDIKHYVSYNDIYKTSRDHRSTYLQTEGV